MSILPISVKKSEFLKIEKCADFYSHSDVELFDFSKCNTDEESRINAVTTVASVCYANPKSIGKISLFNRLKMENKGLPSSSYEFVPVLYERDEFQTLIMEIYSLANTDALRKGTDDNLVDYYNATDDFERFTYNSRCGKYKITNLRAVVNITEFLNDKFGASEIISRINRYNSDEKEIEVIKNHMVYFKADVDLPTRAQMVRHRVIWQELSRRYVSGKKVDFKWYVSDKVRDVYNPSTRLSTEGIIALTVEHYYKLLESGVKPEAARRVLPQAMMTTIWGAMHYSQYNNFLKLRIDDHAQREIREFAISLKALRDEYLGL